MLRYRQPHRLKQRREEAIKRIASDITTFTIMVTNTPDEIEAGFYTDKLAKAVAHLNNLKNKLQ